MRRKKDIFIFQSKKLFKNFDRLINYIENNNNNKNLLT